MASMYGTRSARNTPAPDNPPQADNDLLDKQLARDESGVLRDQLLDELALAAEDIEAALRGKLDATTTRMLGNLLRAVRTSEQVVADAWQSLRPARTTWNP
jgi:hypothetical protein